VTIGSTGLASTLAQGTVTISASMGSISCATTSPTPTCATFTVNAATLSSITVTPTNPTLAKGFTQQFTATATYSDNSTYDVSAYPTTTWASGNTSAVTINSTGLATAANVGSSTITASFGGKSNNTTMTVTAATLSYITIAPLNPSIPVGVTQQFTATGHFSDSSTQDLTASATWTSSNPAIATISSTGLATGIASSATAVTIRATVGAVTSTAALTVNPATLSSIAVTPQPIATIAVGSSLQLTATGTYSDGSQFNITSSVSWSTASARKVTITSGGLATRLKNGAVNINATKSGITGTTQAH
jgi:uncharacterized protein YjdB